MIDLGDHILDLEPCKTVAPRIAATSAQQRLSKSELLGQQLAEAGRSLSAELKRRVELWDKVLLQGLPAAAQQLEEALAGDVAPTFAQATCREDGWFFETTSAGMGHFFCPFWIFLFFFSKLYLN